jgi:hypothetical protein
MKDFGNCRQKLHAGTSKGGTANGTGFLFEIHGTKGTLAIVPTDPRQATYIQVSEFIVRGAQAANRWRISRSRRAIAGFHPRSRRGFLSTLPSCTCGWLKAFARESPPAQTLMWPSNATGCWT